MLTNERSEAVKHFMVGMADLMVSQDQSLVLCTFPLGACLGIAVYDPVARVGGLLHSMLPDSSIDPKRAAARPGMFLDTGLALLLEYADDLMAKRENLLVYVAGGSEVLDETACFNIGKRNYAVLAELLASHGVKIHAEDVGGLNNRSMQLDLSTGEVRSKVSGQARTEAIMQAIDDYISSVRFLPPAPRVVPDLMKLLKQADVDSSKVVKLISFDPALTANVLRICNSAYFGAASPTSDLQEAVTRLGFQQVYQLVAAAMGARMLGAPQTGYGLNEGELWKHSVAVAVTAQLMARKLGDDETMVFTAALLHDIGKIILSQALESVYPKLVKETEMNQQSLLETEKKLLGVQHAEIGARLLERWRFPPSIVSAVWFHHAPKGAGKSQRLASFIYTADMIAHFMGHGYGHLAFALRGRSDALTILGLTSESIPEFLMESFDEMHKVEALFSLAA